MLAVLEAETEVQGILFDLGQALPDHQVPPSYGDRPFVLVSRLLGRAGLRMTREVAVDSVFAAVEAVVAG